MPHAAAKRVIFARYLFVQLSFVAACSNGAGTGAPDSKSLPRECLAYVSEYEACLESSAPSQAEFAHARAETARDSLRGNLHRLGADALATKCTQSSALLQTSCATPRRTKDSQ